MPRPKIITVWDKAERSGLEIFWALGTLIDRGPSKGVKTWLEAMDYIDECFEKYGVIEVHFWGHGATATPLIDRSPFPWRVFVNRMRGKLSRIWFRMCSVARGRNGRRLMARVSNGVGCDVVAHAKVISWPNPLKAYSGVALRPGEVPWWTDHGDELPSCSTLRMTVPAKFYRKPKLLT